MSTTTAPRLMTTEEMLALPDDGTERELIKGRLIERPGEPEVINGRVSRKHMTRRGRRHTRAQGAIAELLRRWARSQPEPRGEVLDGDAGFRLCRDPDSTVGIDIAYISAEMAAQAPEDAYLLDGAPVLAVEILSPSDKHEEIVGKVEGYLNAGVALVWVVETVFRTVTVYQPGQEPVMFNAAQEIVGDPHLPGFRAGVAEMFV